MANPNFIKTAIHHHGVFRAAAQKAGMSTEAFAKKHEHTSGLLGQRARLALTLMGLHKHDAANAKSSEGMSQFH